MKAEFDEKFEHSGGLKHNLVTECHIVNDILGGYIICVIWINFWF